MSRLNFKIEAKGEGSHARAARFRTLHNEVLTPLFMPVGTQASVKAQTVDSLELSGSQILLANTYHLLLRPGPEVFKRFGGIQKFMTWPKSVLTDSGGYQIFSLPHAREMNEQGARFQSYLDGQWFMLSPELSIQTQRAIGSDIMMVLDQCVPSTCTEAEARAAMELTHRWARRSFDAREGSPQSLFGIVQGACYPELRRESALALQEIPFDGFALGGLAVGEGKSEREDVTEHAMQFMPENLPRYLMGVGTPLDILEGVHRGVDMFDCIIPTSFAQRGTVFTAEGKVQLRRTIYRDSDEPVDRSCVCPTCVRFSRGYIHHLIRAEEVYGWQLLGTHNIWFYHRMMEDMRQALLEGRFLDHYKEKREAWNHTDSEPVPTGAKISAAVRAAEAQRFEVIFSDGYANIRDRRTGETMHSVNDPMTEARGLYVEQSQLGQRLSAGKGSELVIWDIGLGAAANAMAAIECFEALDGSVGQKKALRILSFEDDLGSLELAVSSGAFDYLNHPGPEAILRKGYWERKGVKWQLHKGDFRELIRKAAPPDLIFYDIFSRNVQPEMWGSEVFRKILDCCEGRDVELLTYTASTASRAALLHAGFWIAAGISSGPKEETTLALTEKAAKRREKQLLDGSWLERWRRSRVQYPVGLNENERSGFEARILAHPQFSRRLSKESHSTAG